MNLTMEELREIARPFLATASGRYNLTRLHVRPGLLVATDGRRLLHVEDPAIVPGEDDKEPDEGIIAAKFEGSRPIAGPRRLEWLAATIVPIFEEKSREVAERAEAWDAEDEARMQDLEITRCPCCGARVVVDDGIITEFDEWAEENRPDPDYMRGAVRIEANGLDKPVLLSLRNLGMALAAAQKLGGAQALDECENPVVVLRGRGWWIALARLREETAEDEPVIVARIEEEEADNA